MSKEGNCSSVELLRLNLLSLRLHLILSSVWTPKAQREFGKIRKASEENSRNYLRSQKSALFLEA